MNYNSPMPCIRKVSTTGREDKVMRAIILSDSSLPGFVDGEMI